MTESNYNETNGTGGNSVFRRETRTEMVSPVGHLRKQHDLRVSGFMNYKQRSNYAYNKSNDNLKVESPSSLVRKSTEKMYLPRNDKFEGYS